MSEKRIQPDCPACGGSLFVAEGGWLTCSLIGCPDPSYATDVLRAERLRILDVQGCEAQERDARARAPLGREPGEKEPKP